MLAKHTIALLVMAACGDPRSPGGLAELRLTPDEIHATTRDRRNLLRPPLPGVHVTVLHGIPSQRGLYSVLLSVPANTTIQAHSHRDDRIATVVSGTLYFGYGERFDPARLEELPAGSIYSEPGTRSHNHFAQTRDEPVVVHIVGYGPTDTVYVDPAHDPRRR